MNQWGMHVAILRLLHRLGIIRVPTDYRKVTHAGSTLIPTSITSLSYALRVITKQFTHPMHLHRDARAKF